MVSGPCAWNKLSYGGGEAALCVCPGTKVNESQACIVPSKNIFFYSIVCNLMSNHCLKMQSKHINKIDMGLMLTYENIRNIFVTETSWLISCQYMNSYYLLVSNTHFDKCFPKLVWLIYHFNFRISFLSFSYQSKKHFLQNHSMKFVGQLVSFYTVV